MLKGKTIVITGASSGIGRDTARAAISRGAKVIAVDLTEPDFDVTAFYKADLGNRASIDALLERLPSGLDGLANIAGLPPTKPPEDVLRVNFVGLTYLTHRVIPLLSDGASLVNLASLAGFDWERNNEVIKQAFRLDFKDVERFCRDNDIGSPRSYFLSKEALIAWTIANRWTWRDRSIRINAISPGPVETPILGDFLATLGDRAVEDMRLSGAGLPQDIAPAVLFLLSDGAKWITGSNIPVDGGMLAHVLSEQSSLSNCKPLSWDHREVGLFCS